MKLLDGKALPRSLTDPVSNAKAPKGLLLNSLQETGFIEYMDPGTWHLALYNDGRNLEQVLLHSTPIGEDIFSEFCNCAVDFHCLLVFFTLLSFLFVHLLHKTKTGMLVRLILTRLTSEGNFWCFKREFGMAGEILYKGEDSSSNNDRAC